MNLQIGIDRLCAFFASKQSLMRDIRRVRKDMMNAERQYRGDMHEASCNLKRLTNERDAYCVYAAKEELRTATYSEWLRARKQEISDENVRLKKENAELYVLLKVARGIEELKR